MRLAVCILFGQSRIYIVLAHYFATNKSSFPLASALAKVMAMQDSLYYFQTGRRVQARAWRRRACAHRRKEFMLQGCIFFFITQMYAHF